MHDRKGLSNMNCCSELKDVRNLESVSTKDLVEELKQRDGVETTIAEPYVDAEIKVNGPATILTITD